jgi:hypothetical protein
MASTPTTRGVEVIFGVTPVITGWLTEAVELSSEADSVAVQNEVGTTVATVSGIEPKTKGSWDLIFLTGATVPAAGATFTYDSIGYVVDKITFMSKKKDVVKYRLEATVYPDVTNS